MPKITALVENTTTCGCSTAHGLSLYIETPRHRILFDVGGDDTFIKNAERLNINLTKVDTVIISHGHRDHGGALSLFMELNPSATLYIQRQAFAPHFSHRPSGIGNIGLDVSLVTDKRVMLLDGEHSIDDELQLIKVADNSECRSGANKTLFEGDTPDQFDHEQNLIIMGDYPILVMGCGHNGVVNIMNRAKEYSPCLCVGGFHLTNPSAHRDEPRELINEIICRLKEYPNTEFYTCHCTGVEVYEYMHSQMPNIHYLACGDTIQRPQLSVRRATNDDINKVMEIYAIAITYMQQNGNPTQWQGGYPFRDIIEEDISLEHLYLIINEGSEIVGQFCFFVGDDPTYTYIKGEWLNSENYGVVHRLASSGTQKGVARFALEWCFAQHPNIRIDTHADNHTLQHILRTGGYTECGEIIVYNGTTRVAFQREK